VDKQQGDQLDNSVTVTGAQQCCSDADSCACTLQAAKYLRLISTVAVSQHADRSLPTCTPGIYAVATLGDRDYAASNPSNRGLAPFRVRHVFHFTSENKPLPGPKRYCYHGQTSVRFLQRRAGGWPETCIYGICYSPIWPGNASKKSGANKTATGNVTVPREGLKGASAGFTV
jgi:hypothetical protein